MLKNGTLDTINNLNNPNTLDTLSTPPHNAKLAPKFYVANAVTLASYCCLIMSFSVQQLFIADKISLLLWSIQCLPLLVFWPWLRQKNARGYNARAYIGLCFVTLLYFIKGVEGTMSPAANWTDILLLTMSVSLFIGAMLTSRWSKSTQNSIS